MNDKIKTLRRKTDKMLSSYAAARESVKRERKELRQAIEYRENVKEARSITNNLAEAIQRQAHEHIASLVTRCLSAVFGENAYEFRIIFETKRNKTEARMVFIRDGVEFDPMTEAGGGVLDVAAFALRLSVMMSKHPMNRKVLILDEPFRYVSEEYQHSLAELVKTLADELDVQFIIVTHNRELRLGKIVRIE